VIEFLLTRFTEWASGLWGFLHANYDPFRDTADILLVALGIYWLLLLIKGTRAVQILLGLMALIAMRLIADIFDLMTVRWILDRFLSPAVLIIIILFQADIRRALARMGRGFVPRLAEHQESQILEEVVRAAQILSQKRVGALIVLERDTNLEDLVEGGTRVDGSVTKELLVSIFLPYSPLHDGAVIIREGHIADAGCVLPLSARTDLPEGLGTRHRAAVGITEESDAVVVVVSEETAAISVVMAGEITRGLDTPELRVALRGAFTRSREVEAPPAAEAAPEGAADDETPDERVEKPDEGEKAADAVGMR
jgi:diadenylate cyclase